MSINITNVTLHQLVKNDQEELVVNYRAESLEQSALSENLVSELHRTFNDKNGKGFGLFKSDSETKSLVDNLRSGDMGFYEFSQKSSSLLKNELSKYPFADAGTIVLAEYQSLATDYLFIGVVPSKHSLTVTEGLEIGDSDYLDISKMDIAARIDLSTYEADLDSVRYLTFIKGRVGRKIADFFLDFLGAEVGLNTKHQNQVLAQAVQDFVSDAKLDREEATSYKKQVVDYCKEQRSGGDELNVRELSGELPASNEGTSFFDYTQEQGYELEDSFPVDNATMRKLTKFVGAGGGLNVSFESLLLGERVFYDPETDTLTIKGTPPNLRDQLTRTKALDASAEKKEVQLEIKDS